MLYRWLQLVWELVQTRQAFEIGFPPQATNFPPGRWERLIPLLASGKLGIEQVSSIGGGKISTEEKKDLLPAEPPTINCPDTKLIKDQASKDDKYIHSSCSLLLLHGFETRKRDKKTRARASMIVKLN